MARPRFPATAGVFDPRGRLDRDRTLARLERTVVGASERWYADPWFAVGTTPRGTVHKGDGRCTVADGRIENRAGLAARLGLAADAPIEGIVERARREWGAAFPSQLRGAFVVGGWDRSTRTGQLAVDQLAVRSLFYTTLPDGSLAFATEIVVLLALLDTRPAPSPEGIAGWLLDHSVPYGTTLYRGVRRLGSARALVFDEAGWRERPYWRPRYSRPLGAARHELAEALWEQIVGAVDRKLDRDDRPAVILSGGLDSSTVAAAGIAAAAGGKQPPYAYSAVFPEMPSIDESERIDAVVDFLDLDAVELRLQPSGSFALALEYVDTWSLPLQGPGAALEQPLVERAAAEGATVILDGQSGDEVFDHSPYVVADRLLRGRPAAALSLLMSIMPEQIRGARRLRALWKPLCLFGLEPAIPGPIHEALRHARRRQRTLPDWFAAPAGTFDPRVPSQWGWKANPGPRWWAHQLYVSAQMRDRIGATDYLRHRAWSAGAEARPPLLDVDLIEFVLRLPPELGFHTEFPDRPLLREALRERIPEAVRVNVVKSNVAAFYYETIAGPDFAPIRRLLLEGTPEISPYVDIGRVEELLHRQPGVGQPGWYVWFASVWRIAALEAWLRRESDPDFATRTLAGTDVIPTIRADHRVRRGERNSSFFPTGAKRQSV